MFCYGENPVIYTKRVAHFSWKAGEFHVAPRPYAALALRLQGTGVICAGGNAYSISENDIVYLPQGLAYTAEYTDTEMIAIHFVTEKTDSALEVYSPENWDSLLALFQKALAVWELRQPESIPYTLSTLYRILGKLCEEETQNTHPASLSAATAYIQANYAECNLRVQDICAAAGIRETALRQLFWKYYQKTPIEFINALRIEYAQDFIAQGIPIGDAAQKCGFRDSKYFARVVKKHLGCTPKSLKLYGK